MENSQLAEIQLNILTEYFGFYEYAGRSYLMLKLGAISDSCWIFRNEQANKNIRKYIFFVHFFVKAFFVILLQMVKITE